MSPRMSAGWWGDASVFSHAALAQLIARMRIEPPLSPLRTQMQQRMSMGSILKTFVVYNKPWWRNEQKAGIILSDEGPGTREGGWSARAARTLVHTRSSNVACVACRAHARVRQ